MVSGSLPVMSASIKALFQGQSRSRSISTTSVFPDHSIPFHNTLVSYACAQEARLFFPCLPVCLLKNTGQSPTYLIGGRFLQWRNTDEDDEKGTRGIDAAVGGDGPEEDDPGDGKNP